MKLLSTTVARPAACVLPSLLALAAAPPPPAAPVAAAAGAAPAAPAPAATTAAQAAAEADFGLPASSRGPREITSTLPGLFPGWEPRARLRLANGQVWQVIDGSSAVLYLRDPVVKVQRGALGSFFLEIAGTNVSPRVRRVE